MKPLHKTSVTIESQKATRDDIMARPNDWWSRWLQKPASTITDRDKEELFSSIIAQHQVWANDIYCVHVRDQGKGPLGTLVHLSIKRHDRAPITDWRDKQAIKNQLCGHEAEGMELYPAESRVVDTANQYHLWVFKDGPGLRGIGFAEGFKDDADPIGFSQQRKFQKA